MNTGAFRTTTVRVSSSVLLALAALSCASSTSSTPPAVAQTIGPDGGVIVVDGATVTFPPNALAVPTSITITPSDDAPPAGYVALSRVYHCGPSGTTFAQGVTMAMTFHGDPTGARVFWNSGANPAFKDLGGVAQGSVMTAQVLHFSSGFVGKME